MILLAKGRDLETALANTYTSGPSVDETCMATPRHDSSGSAHLRFFTAPLLRKRGFA